MLSKINRHIPNEKAFTLIEVIVSLVLVGIMAVIAGMGLIKIAEGYVFAKQNAETVQKAQIAMARIVKELSATATINSTTPSPISVTYTRPGAVGNIITFSVPYITIGNSGAQARLIDNVTNFTLAYFDAAGGSSPASAADIRRIDITLTVGGANNTPILFSNTVFIKESY